MLRITIINITPVQEETLLAFVSIVLDDAVAIRGLKLIRGHDGDPFVAMPAREMRNGGYQDIVVVTERAFRDELERRVIAEYEKALDGGDASPPG